MPNIERNGWRDESISRRHRLWGTLYAVDIDFILIEYKFEKGRPKAVGLFEYKNEHAPTQYISHTNYIVLADLGSKSCIPAFAVRYANDFSWLKMVSLNEFAKTKILETFKEAEHYNNVVIVTVSEINYVKFLYFLRNEKIPQDIADKIKKLRGEE